MGAVSFSIPQQLVKALIDNSTITNFVETGTFKGNTSIWAASYFTNVFTIEIDPQFSRTASQRTDAKPNIEFIVGDSKTVMPSLINRLRGTTMFWLDGHWCMDAGGKEHECPLIEELIAISKKKDSIILIDDARCFLGPLPPPHQSNDWPRLDEIFTLIKQFFPANTTTIIDDVIVSVPNDFKEILDTYWKSTYHERYSLSYIVRKHSLLSIVKSIVKRF
jgi:hypothetical protein